MVLAQHSYARHIMRLACNNEAVSCHAGTKSYKATEITLLRNAWRS